jgi:hypothetical protein
MTSRCWNPLLDGYELAVGRGDDMEAARSDAIRRHGFAIPTVAAITALAQHSPRGVVEIGAGTGYWAWFADQLGLDVAAFDLHPSPSPANEWFSGTPQWHPVSPSDHHVVTQHPDRTLLIVWPPKNETWPVEALDLYASAGGTCVAYVGEPPRGKTGDDCFHARLGELGGCDHCTYGLLDSPCICGYPPQWTRAATVDLPTWPGYHDAMHLYHPTASGRSRWRARRDRQRHQRGPAAAAGGRLAGNDDESTVHDHSRADTADRRIGRGAVDGGRT